MKCNKCDSENPDNARYCLSCGAKLAMDTGVRCPRCGEFVTSRARFCSECGSPTIPDAQPPVSPSSHAGALDRLAPRQYVEHLLASQGRIAGERRVVTILFSDVKGSTEMAENLDPEDVMEIMNGAFEVLIEPIYRYEGTLARLMGDAILSFFGAPIAHEDDAARACHAALEITKRAREYAGKLERERGIMGFDVRVGINTGLVVVGEVGTDLRVEYTAMGDAVNLAKRMESAAAPGTVMITKSTYKLIAPLFETEALGFIKVKGRSDPVWVFCLKHPKSKSGSISRAAGELSPIFGRDSELARLRCALSDLREGRGGKLAVIGRPGLGKSRLIAEARQSKTDGITWVEGCCMSYARDVSYWIARDIICDLLGIDRNIEPDKLGKTLRSSLERRCPGKGKLPPGGAGPAGSMADIHTYLARLLDVPLEEKLESELRRLEPGELKRRMVRAFCDFIALCAYSQPLVLVWEDLHKIDSSSLELLETLMPLTDEIPLLVLLVFRGNEGLTWDFHQHMRKTYGESYQVIDVPPLNRDDSARLLGSLMGDLDVPREILNLILDNAEGSAFFMEEVQRSLRDAGLMDSHGDGTITAQKVKELGIPTSLHGAIMSRIDHLPPQDKHILQAASVIGRVFKRSVLARTVDLPVDGRELTESLGNLCRRDFLHVREEETAPEGTSSTPPDGSLWRTQPIKILSGDSKPKYDQLTPLDAEYNFKNAVTAEVAYSSLLKSQRRDLHKRVGDAMEGQHPEHRRELSPVLAYHFEKGEVFDKAFHYLIQAARSAVRMYANPAAVAGYRRALSLAERAGERLTASLDESGRGLAFIHEELGDVHYVTGEYREAMEQYAKALDTTGDSHRRSVLDRKMGQVCEKWGKYEEAKDYFEAGIGELGEPPDKNEAAYIYTGLGMVYYHLGELDEAIRLGTSALEMMEELDNERGIAQACNNLGIMNCKNGDYDRAVEFHKRCKCIWEDLGDAFGLASSNNNLGLALKHRGDLERAVVHFEESLELFERLGNQHGLARVYDNLGQLYMEQDRMDEAVECTKKAFVILTEISKDKSEISPEMWQSGAW